MTHRVREACKGEGGGKGCQNYAGVVSTDQTPGGVNKTPGGRLHIEAPLTKSLYI